jgi:hypothetical protein
MMGEINKKTSEGENLHKLIGIEILVAVAIVESVISQVVGS